MSSRGVCVGMGFGLPISPREEEDNGTSVIVDTDASSETEDGATMVVV